MSRLDSMLRRLTAQRDGLNWTAEQIAAQPGDIVDMGLGNGRTYDHLRTLFPDRRIWVIDRVLQCHPSCVPREQDFLQGEAPAMLARLAETSDGIALAHYDFGRGIKSEDVAEAARLSPAIGAVMRPGGLIISGQPLEGFQQITGPDTIDPDRYLFYRA